MRQDVVCAGRRSACPSWVLALCASTRASGAGARRRTERQHGLGHAVARRRSVPPAAERAVAGRLLAQPAPPPGRRQRLPDGGPSDRARQRPGHALGRRLARRLQVVRRRAELAEHAPSRAIRRTSRRQGLASPLKAYSAAADPTVRAGTNGLFYYSGIAFNRGTNIGARLRHAASRPEQQGERRRDAGPSTRSSTVVDGRRRHGHVRPVHRQAVDRRRHPPRRARRRARSARSARRSPSRPATSTWSGAGSPAATSTKIMFSRSLDCGKTWSNPTKLSESNSINQGTNLAIDPVDRRGLRRPGAASPPRSQPDAIVVAKSTDFGKTFPSKNTVEVADDRALRPGDDRRRSSGRTRCRRSRSPSTAAQRQPRPRRLGAAQRHDAGRPDRRRDVVGRAPGARPFAVDTAPDHRTTSAPPFARGHQFMPQLTFSAGPAHGPLLRPAARPHAGLPHPQRPVRAGRAGPVLPRAARPEGRAAGQPGAGLHACTIDDATLLTSRRHTIDLRVAEALAGSALSFTSSTVSQYRFGLRALDDFGNPIGTPIRPRPAPDQPAEPARSSPRAPCRSSATTSTSPARPSSPTAPGRLDVQHGPRRTRRSSTLPGPTTGTSGRRWTATGRTTRRSGAVAPERARSDEADAALRAGPGRDAQPERLQQPDHRGPARRLAAERQAALRRR